MGVNIVSVKCPECGAVLPIEEGRTQIFCSYCGAKVIITNENEYIYRHIDEAGIRQAETDRLIKLKQMEFVEKKRAEAERTKKLKIAGLLIFIAVSIIMIVSGFLLNPDSGFSQLSLIGSFMLIFGMLFSLSFFEPSRKSDDEDFDFGDKVKVPSGIIDYENKIYTAIEAILRGAGFRNIECVPLNDLTLGLLKKPNTVESITINGKRVSRIGEKFPPDAKVIITYHSVTGR